MKALFVVGLAVISGILSFFIAIPTQKIMASRRVTSTLAFKPMRAKRFRPQSARYCWWSEPDL